MVASPKLSRWFYLSEQRNCRLAPQLPEDETPLVENTRGRPSKFTALQQQTIIELIKAHPRRPSIVKKEFAKAWPGLAVTAHNINSLKLKAIKAGNLKL